MKVSQLVVVKDRASYMDVNEGDVWVVRDLDSNGYIALSLYSPVKMPFNVSTGLGIVYAKADNLIPFTN